MIINAAQGHTQESVVEPTVSVCRKGDNLYLTLNGDFNQVSSHQLFQMLRNLVMTSMKCFIADFPMAFTLKTHGKVDYKKTSQV